MIGVDANILIYAHRSESPFYEKAAACMRELAEGRSAWAVYQINLWLGSEPLKLIGETSTHWSVLHPILIESDVKTPLVHDGRIAAICLQHGLREFWTADRDFSRFPTLKCRNPLIG